MGQVNWAYPKHFYFWIKIVGMVQIIRLMYGVARINNLFALAPAVFLTVPLRVRLEDKQ